VTSYSDAGQVLTLLENALGGKPALTEAQLTILVGLAEGADGTYSSEALDRVAATGWSWKAALTADKYDIGGGSGVYLKRSDWFTYCQQMAASYRNGTASVDGSTLTGADGELGEPITIRSNYLTEGW